MHDQRYYLGGWPTMVVVMPGIFPAHTPTHSPVLSLGQFGFRIVIAWNAGTAQRQGTSFARCGRASSYRSHLFAGQPPSSSHSVRVLVSLFATAAAATYRVWPVSPARSLVLIDDMWNVKGFANSYKINSAYMDRKHSSPPLAVHSRL